MNQGDLQHSDRIKLTDPFNNDHKIVLKVIKKTDKLRKIIFIPWSWINCEISPPALNWR